MRKSFIRIICFILCLCGVLYGINKIFKVKYGDGIYSVTKYYELERDTVDVLFLGSSHAFEDFNTGTLWDEFGMSSYILAGSAQPMWNTYYYLKEALKTQTPKVIVLEGYLVVWQQEYIDDSRIIKNNYGLRWSPDKINSLKISSPRERWSEFFLEYEQYHTRYKELSAEDFLPYKNNKLYEDWKGFGCNLDTYALEAIDVSAVTGTAPLYEKTEEYYRKVIELAQANDIPIVVMISPYGAISEYEQQMFNTANEIAKEYGVPFINYNLYVDDMGLDYKTDAADGAHLNFRGNQKYTKFAGQYLKDNYELENHRGDAKYESWRRSADYTRQMIYNKETSLRSDIDSITKMIKNDYYWVAISIDGEWDVMDANGRLFLREMGMPDNASSGIWLLQSNEIVWSSGEADVEKYIQTAEHDFCFRHVSEGNINEMIIDRDAQKKVINGINVVVYDTVTEKIVDVFGINADDAYNIVR